MAEVAALGAKYVIVPYLPAETFLVVSAHPGTFYAEHDIELLAGVPALDGVAHLLRRRAAQAAVGRAAIGSNRMSSGSSRRSTPPPGRRAIPTVSTRSNERIPWP